MFRVIVVLGLIAVVASGCGSDERGYNDNGVQGGVTTGAVCSDDDLCGDKICENGRCRPGCRDSAGCDAGEVCERTFCVTLDLCEDDEGCAAGEVCVAGQCRDASDGLVRLADGDRLSGRVEVYVDGVWGTVCDDGFDLNEAAVICRQLGFSMSVQAFAGHEHSFGRGDGLIWLDELGCAGDELDLLSCPRSPLGQHDCGPSEDAAVRCRQPCAQRSDCGLGMVCVEGDCAIGECLAAADCPGEEICTEARRCSPRECDEDADCDGAAVCEGGACAFGEGAVRLVGGDGRSGRLEVYHRGAWGTVCDDDFDEADARVVCRQLGFGAGRVGAQGLFGAGTGTIWLDDVACVGDEATLLECPTGSPIGTHNCNHQEDVVVVCEEACRQRSDCPIGRVCLDGACVAGVCATDADCPQDGLRCGADLQCFTPNCDVDDDCGGLGAVCLDGRCSFTGGEVRLVGGGGPMEGRVEVFINDAWGTVCDDGFDLNEAEVICRQLGMGGAEEALQGGSHTFGQGEGPIWLDDLDCAGDEEALTRCPSSGVGQHNCGHAEDAAVRCALPCDDGACPEGRVCLDNACVTGDCLERADCPDEQVCTAQRSCIPPECAIDADCTGGEAGVCAEGLCVYDDGAVRLVGGSAEAGRLEVFLNGEWGTVCHLGFDLNEAEVICRQLGFPGALAALPGGSHAFGIGVGPVWLEHLGCEGVEEAILACPPEPPEGGSSCPHDFDVAVLCREE